MGATIPSATTSKTINDSPETEKPVFHEIILTYIHGQFSEEGKIIILEGQHFKLMARELTKVLRRKIELLKVSIFLLRFDF